MPRLALSKQLEDQFDPTDAEAAMQVAASALRLLRVCERVLFASHAGLHVNRDDSIALTVRMREVGEAMGLLGHYAAGAAAEAFHLSLAKEAGVKPSSIGHN